MNAARVFDDIFAKYSGPRFKVRLWDGRERGYGAGEQDAFTLTLASKTAFQGLLTRGSLGFGEAYMEGSLQIEGDLDEYLRIRHRVKSTRKTWRLMMASLVARVTTPHSRPNQISYHYDLGNDFFGRLLGEDTLSYSAGLFDAKRKTLETAQKDKLRLLARWLDLPAGAHVLDLGSGWGGFALHAAKEHQWQVSGCSLSKKQIEHLRSEVEKRDLENRVQVGFKDMTKPFVSTYDGAVSIESIEHVGKDKLRPFLKNVANALHGGAPFVLQLTGRYVARRVDSWTLKYVFPGGYLPAKFEIDQAARENGFVIEEFRDDTADYLATMACWIHNLEMHREFVREEYGAEFYRLWELWMHGAKVAFENEYMSLFRYRLRKER